MEPEHEYFHLPVWSSVVFGTLAGVVPGLVVATIWHRGNPPLDGALLGAGVGALIGLGFSGLCVYLSPVRIGADGVRGSDYWGRSSTIAWRDIATVEKYNQRIDAGRYPFLATTLRYLIVTAVSGSRIYIPLFLSDLPRFHARVVDLAGPKNPLSQMLEELKRAGRI